MPHYDAIVLGVGGIGSAAMFHLARRGLRVLGVEQLAPGHDSGSSHGETRAIRKAYFEHPDYVPLLHRAYDNWDELQSLLGSQLLHRVGLLEVGPPESVLISGIRRAAEQYQLPLEELSRSQVRSRFRGFEVPTNSVAMFEPDGGYLLVEACVQAHVQLAQRAGAELLCGTQVTGWESRSTEIVVYCREQTFTAERLIITAGAWSAKLLNELGIRLRVLRKHLHWFATSHAAAYAVDAGSPVFFYDTPQGFYYGFPSLDQRSLKIAEHSGGETIEEPDQLDRSPDPQETARVVDFLRRHLTLLTHTEARHSVCMYTMSPDENFIVDQHPHEPRITLAAGLSGHGFKFASVLGEVLADLACSGSTRWPIDFLRLRRFN